MKNKLKAILLVFLTSIIFFMMISNRYGLALGDYLLETIGLRAWSEYNSGVHLTVLYFGIIFICLLFIVNNYVIYKLKFSKKRVLILFIVFVTVFYQATGIIRINIKKHAEGLQAIDYSSEKSRIDYKCINNEYTEFTAIFTLRNYSDEKKIFYIGIDYPDYRREGIEGFSICSHDGHKAQFELSGNSTKTFEISLEDYEINGGMKFENGGMNGIINEIILSNDNGEIVRLENDNFIGITMDK